MEQGWNSVDNNPAGAADLFKQALDVSSTNSEANYGYGYAKLLQGDPTTAKRHMCKALPGVDEATKREIRGMLNRNNLACD